MLATYYTEIIAIQVTASTYVHVSNYRFIATELATM